MDLPSLTILSFLLVFSTVSGSGSRAALVVGWGLSAVLTVALVVLALLMACLFQKYRSVKSQVPEMQISYPLPSNYYQQQGFINMMSRSGEELGRNEGESIEHSGGHMKWNEEKMEVINQQCRVKEASERERGGVEYRVEEETEREREVVREEMNKGDTPTEWSSGKTKPMTMPKPQKEATKEAEVTGATGNAIQKKKPSWTMRKDSVDGYVHMQRSNYHFTSIKKAVGPTTQGTTIPTTQSEEVKIKPGYANLFFSESTGSAQLITQQGSTSTSASQAPPSTTPDDEVMEKRRRYINIDMDDPEADILAVIAAARASCRAEQHPIALHHSQKHTVTHS